MQSVHMADRQGTEPEPSVMAGGSAEAEVFAQGSRDSAGRLQP